jgi:two-component system phosphate regulon response regulator PhoB
MGGSILVVEDEAAIRDLLAANLQRAGYKVLCAGDVPQAEALVRDSRPDLVLLDWVLPGVPGLTFARRLRSDQRTKDISIVLLSARAEEQDKVTALESGADDYVTKPFSTPELLARVRARLRERSPQSNVIEYRDVVMDRDRHEVHRGGKPVSLTAKEYALLEYLLLHRNRVHTRDELFNGVWGSDFLGDSNLIDVYVRYLRGKIDDGFDDKLITTVRGVGYTIKD